MANNLVLILFSNADSQKRVLYKMKLSNYERMVKRWKTRRYSITKLIEVRKQNIDFESVPSEAM